MHILVILFACIDSGYLDNASIRSWATSIVSKVAEPQMWLIELLGSKSTEESLNILRTELPKLGLTLDHNYAELVLGFLYLMFIDKKLTEGEFKTELIDIIDAYDVEDIDPELLHGLFEDKSDIIKKNRMLSDLLSGFSHKSEESYRYIMHDDCIEMESSILYV